MDGRHHDRQTSEPPSESAGSARATPQRSSRADSEEAGVEAVAPHLSGEGGGRGTQERRWPQSASSVSETDATVITHEPPIPPRPNVEYLHPRELGHALEGQRLDHFELVDFIGGGGMGAVFRAHDTLLDRVVAVKVLASGHAENEETRLRFRNEAQSAARLDHANIARVHFVGEDQGVHYIVFEYIEGVNIRDLVQSSGPLPIEQALSYTLQIAEALAHAGERDVVHRDIKPSNILVTEEGQAKLVDMGLARMQHLGDRDDLTATGVTLGTFDYISPEQARDPRNADTRSDIYSLGCTLFFMLCGTPPFPDGTVLQKLLQHQEDVPPELRSHRDDLSPEISGLVRTMLAKSPEGRFQTPTQLISTLVTVAEQANIPLSRPATSAPLWIGAPSDAPIRRHLPWMIPVAILVLCVFMMDVIGRRNDLPMGRSGRVEPPSVPRTAGPEITTPPRQPPASQLPPVDRTDRDVVAPPPRSNGTSGESTTVDPGGAASAVATDWSSDDERPSARPGGASPTGSPLARTESMAVSGLAYLTSSGVTAPVEVAALFELLSQTGAEQTPLSTKIESNTSSETMAPKDRRDVPLVVAANGRANQFRSLGEACQAAESGQVIELRFDGPIMGDDNQPIWEPPIVLGDKHLTIRAGVGFRPLLRFRPDRPVRGESSGVMNISQGTLRLVHLDIEVDSRMPPESPAAPLSVVAANRADSIIVSGCRISVFEGNRASSTAPSATPPAAFFSLNHEVDPAHSPPVGDGTRIRLDNCILRGDAALVRAGTATPIDLAWSNGLFVTSRHLIERTESTVPAGDRAAARIELTHLTAVLPLGMIEAPTDSADRPGRPLTIRCQDSLIIGQASTVLIDQPKAELLDAKQEWLIWRGERTCYHGVEVFWRLGSAADVPLQLGFEGWRDYWALHPWGEEIRTARTTIRWKNQPGDRLPIETARGDDFVIDDSDPDLPELHAASDGGPVGMRFDLLPSFDVEPPPSDP